MRPMTIDEYTTKPYRIVDILPMQVPPDGRGQYFEVEKYYLKRISLLCKQYTDLLLKLNCYLDIEFSHDGDNWTRNPAPETFEYWVGSCLSAEPSESSLFIALQYEETLMVIERDCTYMTIYNSSEELLALINQLVCSAGLFLWTNPISTKNK